MFVLWSKPACVQCNAVKRWFAKEGADYIEKQIMDDLDKLEEFRLLGIMQAPIVEAPGVGTFSGFRPDLLEESKNYLQENPHGDPDA